MRFNGKERGTTAPDFLSRRAAALCALLLALMAAQMLAVIRQKSITVDEWVMIPAGYCHLTEGDYRPVSEHPPFAKVIAAAPLVLAGAKAPPKDTADAYSFWHANAARFDYLSFWARVPAIAVTVLLGALVFVYARRHWGGRAALFGVALYSLEPTVLAHGRVAQTDIPSALALLVFSFTFYEYLKAPDARRAVYTGLAAGFAAVTKFSMVALAPVLAVALAALFVLAPRRGLRRARVAGHACALACAAVLAVNAAYFFHHRQPEPLDDALARLVVPARVTETLHAPLEAGYYALQVVFPADFVSGIGWQLGHAHEGHPAGLLGMWRQRGWWYYFPVAFALKTTLPFLLLSLASLAWALLRLRRKVEGRVLVLVVPLALFTGLLMLSTINIGVRYYLPAYPFLFILSGAMLDDVLRRSARRAALPAVLAAVSLCLGWAAVEAARAYPDHMSYMNQLASRAPHWWYLSDSNVEWGDDVRDLAAYLRARGEARVRGAFLGGFLTLRHYGVEYLDLLPEDPAAKVPAARYTAIGASFLNGSTVPRRQRPDGGAQTDAERVNAFDSYRRRAPEAVFGGSIYLFREDGQ